MASPEGQHPIVYITVAVIGLTIYYISLLLPKLDAGSKVKMVPGGMLKAIQTMTSRDLPSLMLKQYECVNHDPLFRIHLPFPGGAYIVADAAMQKEILCHPGTDKPKIFYDNITRITGHLSTITHKTSNPRWKHLRKGSAPAFASKEVSRMDHIAAEHIHRWMESVLDPMIDNPDRTCTFDPGYEMTKLTFRIILEAGFEYSSTDQEFDTFIANSTAALIEFGHKQALNPLRRVFAFMIPEARQALASCKELQKFGYKILHAYRDNVNKLESNTLMKLIETNPHSLTDREKMTEIITYIFAGHDTVGHTLGSTLVLLAKHQDIQTKVIESLPKNAVVPSEYLSQVLQESKRCMPVTAMGSLRTVSHHFDFGAGMILPRGANVLLPQMLPRHDPNVFDRPEEFLPERWESSTKSMINSMITYSYGDRSCIGQSLAQAELNTVLPVLLSNYRFEIVDEGKPDFFVTLKFEGARLKVSKI